MDIEFKTKKLKEAYLYSGKAFRRYGEIVGRKYISRVNLIKSSKNIDELKSIPSLRCHELKGDRKGQWAMKLTGYYRLIFTLKGNDLEIVRIEEVSGHYGD